METSKRICTRKKGIFTIASGEVQSPEEYWRKLPGVYIITAQNASIK